MYAARSSAPYASNLAACEMQEEHVLVSSSPTCVELICHFDVAYAVFMLFML